MNARQRMGTDIRTRASRQMQGWPTRLASFIFTKWAALAEVKA